MLCRRYFRYRSKPRELVGPVLSSCLIICLFVWTFHMSTRDIGGDGSLMRNPAGSVYKPICLSENRFYVRDVRERHKHFLTVHTYGRLGNQLFQYAALLGLADTNSMIPCLREEDALRQVFSITAAPCAEEAIITWPIFEDEKASAYDSASESLNYELHLALSGYFQSWRYFNHTREKVARELRFRREVKEKADAFIEDALSKFESDAGEAQFVTVGIHIRRGDMLEDFNVEKGYTVADKGYLSRAIKHFATKLGGLENIIFIVCSDDVQWAMKILGDLGVPNFAVSHSEQNLVDLAILGNCDHMIMTVGTYGWWAAWLSGGDVVYYKDFPASSSPLHHNFKAADYYPPHWVGL